MKLIFSASIILIFLFGCHQTENYEPTWDSTNTIVNDNETDLDASLNDTLPSGQATLISDEEIMEQVEYFQKHLKIGADRDTLTNHFKDFLREPIFNESGDAPYKDGESYAFTTLDDPYKLEINDTIRGRGSDATIIDIFHDGDYLIKNEDNEKESILQPKTLRVMLDRLIPNFIETRKIGVIAHVFFDQDDLVTLAYLTFVHGSENNVYRIGYMPDGTVTFTINEFHS